MKTINFSGQKFLLGDKSHSFLKNYLGRIGSYIEKNNLDLELLQDIEERIFEYLSGLKHKQKKITQEKVVHIVNEIGEPEEIFENYEYEEDKNQAQRKTTIKQTQNFLKTFTAFFQKITKRFFNEAPLFLGVCSFLDRKTKIPAVFYRLFFVLTAFFYGVSIVIYLIFAFFFVGSEELLSRRDSISSSLIETIAVLRSNFFNLIRWCFFGLLSLIFMFFTGVAFFGTAFTNTPWTIDNQNIFAYFPKYIPGAFLAITISCVIFTIWSFGMLFRKHFLHRIFYFISIITLVFGLFGILSGGFEVLNHYTTFYKNTRTFEIASQENELYYLELPNQNQNHLIDITQHWTKVDFHLSPDDKIRIKFISRINAASETEATKIFANLTPIEFKENGKTLSFEIPEKTFQTETPYAFYSYNIEVLLPSKVYVQFKDSYSHFLDLNVNEFINEGNLQLHFDANDNPIGYDSTSKKFRVYPSEQTLQATRDERFKQDLEQQFERKQAILDNINLLKKGNSSIVIKADEQLSGFEWLDPQKAKVKIGERCFTIYYTSYGPWPDETYENCEELLK